jgi:hypothetical protein
VSGYGAAHTQGRGYPAIDKNGSDVMREIQSEAWEKILLPQLPTMLEERMQQLPAEEAQTVVAEVGCEAANRREHGAVVTINPFKSRPDVRDLSQGTADQGRAGRPRVSPDSDRGVGRRRGHALRARCDVRISVGGVEVLPAVRELKNRWMKLGDGTVEALMTDIQMGASSFPGKAFEMTFAMPEPDVGIMTFKKCIQVEQWEALGRPDIAEKSAHVTCPASIIETAKMYNPNMKVEILAVPPRVSKDEVCCRWRLCMRDQSDPEYFPPAE